MGAKGNAACCSFGVVWGGVDQQGRQESKNANLEPGFAVAGSVVDAGTPGVLLLA